MDARSEAQAEQCGSEIVANGVKVRLWQQGNPDTFADGRKNSFTIASHEKHNGLNFYRVHELPGALFLESSFAVYLQRPVAEPGEPVKDYAVNPDEEAIQARMIQTLCNMLQADSPAYRDWRPDKIQELVREIAERELKEQP